MPSTTVKALNSKWQFQTVATAKTQNEAEKIKAELQKIYPSLMVQIREQQNKTRPAPKIQIQIKTE